MMKDQIISLLPPGHPWGELLQCFDCVESTNTLAKAMAASGSPAGTVLIADSQTGGRGRRGRSFHSPSGTGIYMSAILRPGCAPTELMHLTCAVAVAMCDAVEKAAGFRPGIKWTNDLVFGKRKLAGILTELGLSPSGTVDYAVIGIGVNCTQESGDFPEEIREIAGSVSMAAGGPVDRAALAAAMVEALAEMDQTLLSGRQTVLDRYRRDCITLGQDIALIRGDEIRHGKALDIDPEGALIVRFAPGHVETVSSGEVSVRGMYGYL